MPADLYRSPIPEQLWERIRNEFHLPSLEQVHERLSAIHEDPEPMMRQLVRVFIDDEGTYCPGFQFRPDLTLDPVVLELFERAMELRIPHNYFALWMMVPSPALQGSRPVDLRRSDRTSALLVGLETDLPRQGSLKYGSESNPDSRGRQRRTQPCRRRRRDVRERQSGRETLIPEGAKAIAIRTS